MLKNLKKHIFKQRFEYFCIYIVSLCVIRESEVQK